MAFDTPADLDFTKWDQDFLSVIRNRCIGGDMKFTKSWLELGDSLFDGLREEKSRAALENVLLGSSIGPYLTNRWLYILLLVLGLLLFLIGVAAACGIWLPVRQFYSRWLCGTCRSRSRPRFKSIKPRFRSILCLVTIIVGGMTVGLTSLFLATNTQGLVSFRSADCGMWLQLYGHFFGTDSIDSTRYDEIATNWQGTVKLKADIGALAPRLEPGIDNPIYRTLKDLQGPLIENATLVSNEMIDIAYSIRNLSNFHSTMLADAWAAIPHDDRGKRSPPTLSVQTVLMHKSDKLINVTTTLLKQGDDLISDLLDKYAGPQSPLMAKGYQAVKDSLDTLSQIDESIAFLTREWRKFSDIFNIGGWIITIVSYLFGIACIAVVVLNVVLAIFLLKHLRNDTFVRSREKMGWKIVYTGYAVLGGLAALLAGLHLMISAVGVDVCNIVDDSLFTQGRWELLGNDLMNPRHNTTVDVKAVFETCVRRGGLGNIAVSMFMDARIAELSEDVANAENDIMTSQANLIQRDEQVGRVDNLGIVYQELLRSYIAPNVREDTLSTSIPQPIFPDYRIVHMDEKHQDTEGRNVVLCFLPTMDIKSCLSAGMWYVVASVNDAYDYLNKLAEQVHKADPTTSFPQSFCGYLGARAGDCATRTEPVWLDSTVLGSQLSAWSKEIPKDMAYDTFTDYVPERALHLMRTLWLNEKIANYTVKAVSPYTECPAEGCLYDLWRHQDILKCEAARDMTRSNLTQLLQLFDTFLYDNVIPQMQSLVDEADALTDHANCQYEGTAIDNGVRIPLCQGYFPGALVSSMLLLALSIVLWALGAHAWQWTLFIIDISDAFNHSPSGYDTPAFLSMNQRAEYVAYTGLPYSTSRRGWDSARIESDLNNPSLENEVNHGQIAPTKNGSEISHDLSYTSYITHCTERAHHGQQRLRVTSQHTNSRRKSQASVSSYQSYR